ncbi:MAG: DUF3341 domain-containing protein [Bdellovibrionota bacterium]
MTSHSYDEGKTPQPENKKLYGVLAEFNSAAEVYEACKKVRAKGFTKWDAYSPFPIHGLDKAMGLGQSKLPWLVGGVALVCGLGGFLLWSWMNAVDYKYIIAGKPFYSWPAYFLPGFECAVLSAAATCLFGMLALNRLPQLYHPLFKSSMFNKVTDDKFFISIEKNDAQFHSDSIGEFLRELGANKVEFVEE